ncbi:MAG: PadR family transcriptional regulator [Oscillospiraceae bacterium]
MTFTTGAALLDALVLSVVSNEDSYGYKITQEVREAVDVSESTLYPVLRRLQKDGCLDTYDQEFAGRNRRYYRLTVQGIQKLAESRKEWKSYRKSIETVLYGGDKQ